MLVARIVSVPTSLDFGELGADDLGRLADGRDGLVRLSSGSVDRLHPQSTLTLVVRREHDLVALAHRVEEVLAAVQTCRTQPQLHYTPQQSCRQPRDLDLLTFRPRCQRMSSDCRVLYDYQVWC